MVLALSSKSVGYLWNKLQDFLEGLVVERDGTDSHGPARMPREDSEQQIQSRWAGSEILCVIAWEVWWDLVRQDWEEAGKVQLSKADRWQNMEETRDPEHKPKKGFATTLRDMRNNKQNC